MVKHWNYRVIKNGNSFSIHEVYYDEETGNPSLCSVDPIAPYGESLEELVSDTQRMMEAFSKPILNMEIFNKKQ